MTPEAALEKAERNHIPVLLAEVVEAVAPKAGEVILDGTFGAGGYSRALLAAADCRVIGVDQDPDALSDAAQWQSLYGERLSLLAGNFAALDTLLPADAEVDAVVLDIGVSSMQLDQSGRGFSFLRDGPLDMRMSQDGPTASTIVNQAEEAELADIFFQYGEEKRAWMLARAIGEARKSAPIETTAQLSELIEKAAPRGRSGPHPATRVFQALRIAVNDELGALLRGLAAAEKRLCTGGRLVVVTFHSLEDRIVKRFFQSRTAVAPSFELIARKPVLPSAEERNANPRARSAKLRGARRTDAAPLEFDPRGFGLPGLALKRFE